MRRGGVWFVLLYGVAMMIFAATLGFRTSFHQVGVVLGLTGAGCVFAALGLWFAKCGESVPSKRWVAGIVLLIVVQWTAFFNDFPAVTLHDLARDSRSMAFLIPFAVAAFLFLHILPRHFQGSGRRILGVTLVGAITTGAVLILLTLVLTTTEDAGSAKGWQIVAQKARWITYTYDLARIPPETSTTSWLCVLFAVGGCAAYLLALIAALMAAAWVVNLRALPPRLSRSHWLPWLAAASCFTTFYVYNDIY